MKMKPMKVVIEWTEGNQIVLISDKVRGSLDEFGNSIKFKDRIFPVIVLDQKKHTSD